MHKMLRAGSYPGFQGTKKEGSICSVTIQQVVCCNMLLTQMHSACRGCCIMLLTCRGCCIMLPTCRGCAALCCLHKCTVHAGGVLHYVATCRGCAAICCLHKCTVHAGGAALCLGLARTIYIRCTYGNFGLEITKYTVYIYVYIGSGQP